jgi:lysophospholipase L1-like esterase
MPVPSDLANLQFHLDADVGRYDATSGGSSVTSDGAVIKGWEDPVRGVRVTQGTTANCPVYDATKGLVVSSVGQGDNRFFNVPAGISLNARAFSLFAVCELTTLRRMADGVVTALYHFFLETASANANPHYAGNDGKLSVYDGGFKQASLQGYNQRCLIGFVGGAAGLTVYLNNGSSSVAVLNAGTSDVTAVLGAASSAFASQAGFKDLFLYSRAITGSEFTDTVLPYAVSRAVETGLLHQIAFEGDSITHGWGATVNRGYIQRLALPSTLRFRCTAESGITLSTLASEAATRLDPLIVGGETNVLVIYAGTNDIDAGATGANTETALKSYVDARKAAGWNHVGTVTPLPRGVGTISGQFAAYRTAILARAAGTYDFIIDPCANTAFASAWTAGANTVDGIHPNDTGYQQLADLVQTAVDGYFPRGGGGMRRLWMPGMRPVEIGRRGVMVH